VSYEPLYHKDSSSPSDGRDGRKLILSVDDDLAVLYTRFKLLAAAGYGVLSASDAAQALQIFADYQVDLVLMDYALPEMDGGLLAEAMKTHRPDIPIIMISGVEVPEKVLALVNDFVTKGAGAQALISSIQQVLTASSSRSQNKFVS
jgi:CheY-like chemotaxis protein